MQTVPRSNTDIMFFDGESTGLPLFKERSNDPRQPHLVSLAGLRYSAQGELVGVVSMTVKPDGWVIPEETIAIHGITNEMAHEQGNAEAVVLAAFSALYDGCALRVAHNRNCDDRFIRSGLARYASEEEAEEYKARPGACTALLSRDVCKIPPTEAMAKTNFKNTFKTPSLAEAFAHLTGGMQLEDAHTAFADAQACARIYFLLQGIRMPQFPDDADALRNEVAPLPHGKDECDAVQIDIMEQPV